MSTFKVSMSSFLDQEDVSLSNLAGGAAIERFDLELRRCLENILDQNTESTKKRTITLKVTLAPSEDRDFANVGIGCVAALAPLQSLSSRLYIGLDVHGNPIARQNQFKQITLEEYRRAKEEERKVPVPLSE